MVNIIYFIELLPLLIFFIARALLVRSRFSCKCFHDAASKVPMHKSHLPLSLFIALTTNADMSSYKQSAVSNASIWSAPSGDICNGGNNRVSRFIEYQCKHWMIGEPHLYIGLLPSSSGCNLHVYILLHSSENFHIFRIICAFAAAHFALPLLLCVRVH